MDTKEALARLEQANKDLKKSHQARDAQQQLLLESLLLLIRVLIERML